MRLFGGILVAAVLAAGAAESSSARVAPIRECGALPQRLAFNITSRKVSCGEARRVVRRWSNTTAQRGGSGYRDTGYEAGDIRCAGSRSRVVRWQTGS